MSNKNKTYKKTDLVKIEDQTDKFVYELPNEFDYLPHVTILTNEGDVMYGCELRITSDKILLGCHADDINLVIIG